jgi:hypothetical protein
MAFWPASSMPIKACPVREPHDVHCRVRVPLPVREGHHSWPRVAPETMAIVGALAGPAWRRPSRSAPGIQNAMAIAPWLSGPAAMAITSGTRLFVS